MSYTKDSNRAGKRGSTSGQGGYSAAKGGRKNQGQGRAGSYAQGKPGGRGERAMERTAAPEGVPIALLRGGLLAAKRPMLLLPARRDAMGKSPSHPKNAMLMIPMCSVVRRRSPARKSSVLNR